MRQARYADIWVPYTTAKTDAYKSEIMGGWNAMALARDRAAMAGIHEEFNSRLLRVELDDPKAYQAIVAPFETRFESFARLMPTGDRKDPERQVWQLVGLLAGLALLFVLIPTVNLVNINISRIMERASEIGVRKAFGAPARTLVGQFLVENILLTLVGGIVGFVLSMVVLRAIDRSGLFSYAHFTHQSARVRLRHGAGDGVRPDLRRLSGVAHVAAQPGRRAEGRRFPMTRHLLRLIWNRKRQNFLLTVEIFFSFLALFGVVLCAVHYANNSRQPLGFWHRSRLEHGGRPQGVRRGPGSEGAAS